jgi:hypothetical protein
MAVSVRGEGALSFEATIGMAQFDAQLQKIEQGLQKLTVTAESQAKAVDNLVSKTATAIAGYLSLTTATDFIGKVVQIRGEFQQLEVAFTTMLRSKGQADLLLAQAVELAAKTPFTLQDVGGAAKQLLAYGFAANEVTENITMLGNIASGVGAPLQDVVYLYGTLRTQGQVFTKDLLQFTGRGIPIVAELAKQFGVAESEVKSLVEAGKVGFPDVERAFRSLTNEGGTFFNLMENSSKTLTGQLSNLEDAWSRMLDDIGKSNEGLLSGAIDTAINLVKNYESIIRIIKILIGTYGSYRAALIVTNALTLTQAELTAGVTLAQKLHAAAVGLADRAMKLLNATMLTNPYVAVATALGAVVTALIVFKKESNGVASAQELIKQGMEETNARYDEQKAKVQALVAQLKAGNITEEQRLDIYNQLKAINPSIVEGLNAQSISYQNITRNVEDYLNSLRKQIQLEANSTALTASIQKENSIKQQIEQQEKLVKSLEKVDKGYRGVVGGSSFGTNTGAAGSAGRLAEEQAKLNDLQKQYDAQQKVSADLAVTNNDIVGNSVKERSVLEQDSVKSLDEKIKKYKEERDAVSRGSATYKEFTKAIKELERQRAAITGESTKQTPAEKAADRTREQLKDLLVEISQAENEINNIGLTSQQAEIARIEAKYDEFRRKAEELKADAGVFARIDKAEENAIGAERRQQRVENYREYLNEQQSAFSEFEKAKLEIGTDAAQRLYETQVGGFTDYIQFLKVQLATLSLNNTAEGLQKREVVAKQLADAEKRRDDELTQQKIKNIQEVTEKTITFNIRRRQIEEEYQQDLQTLRETFTGTEFEERAAALKQSRDQELADLNSTAARSSDIYRKLNEDILLFTRQQLIARKRDLENYLATGVGIPPKVREDIRNYIEQLDDLIKTTSGGIIDPKQLQNVAEQLDVVSSGFGQLASAVKETNEGLGDTLQTMSDITSIASNVLKAIAGFASGNIVQGVAATIGAVIGVFKLVSDARKSVIEAQKEIADFNLKVLQGEIDINVLYRERAAEQAKINQLRIKGIQDEARALKASQQSNTDDFNRILALLQKEQFISGQRTEQYGGFLGIGRKTRVVDVYSSLAGKTYEDLEKLFLSGRLEGRAAELFKTLEKLKQEGLDIDAALLQNQQEAQSILTGTTAESIADTIAQGFQNGLRSASDFAQSFEDLMRGAIINALKYQTLEGPLQQFYDEFAKNAESDGVLTEEEIKQLRNNFNDIITNAGDKFEELQKITDINFDAAGSTSSQKGLAGAIRGITADQADLLAGQFGGLRLTAVDQLRVSSQGLVSLQRIELYTANLVAIRSLWERLELNGIKVK